MTKNGWDNNIALYFSRSSNQSTRYFVKNVLSALYEFKIQITDDMWYYSEEEAKIDFIKYSKEFQKVLRGNDRSFHYFSYDSINNTKKELIGKILILFNSSVTFNNSETNLKYYAEDFDSEKKFWRCTMILGSQSLSQTEVLLKKYNYATKYIRNE